MCQSFGCYTQLLRCRCAFDVLSSTLQLIWSWHTAALCLIVGSLVEICCRVCLPAPAQSSHTHPEIMENVSCSARAPPASSSPHLPKDLERLFHQAGVGQDGAGSCSDTSQMAWVQSAQGIPETSWTHLLHTSCGAWPSSQAKLCSHEAGISSAAIKLAWQTG